MIHVFAYGSNMCTERLRARAATAVPLVTGYVTHRKLAFHKRGRDGSAKADAVYTGRSSDRVWGVVFSLTRDDKLVLNGYEWGYGEQKVVVIGQDRVLPATIYVARSQLVDAALKPYGWYHHLVVEGAIQHRLPRDYVEHLQTFRPLPDTDFSA